MRENRKPSVTTASQSSAVPECDCGRKPSYAALDGMYWDAAIGFAVMRDALEKIAGNDHGHNAEPAAAAIAQAALDRATNGTCGICGDTDDVAFRGWVDEGSAMQTCASCGSPDAPVPQSEREPLASPSSSAPAVSLVVGDENE